MLKNLGFGSHVQWVKPYIYIKHNTFMELFFRIIKIIFFVNKDGCLKTFAVERNQSDCNKNYHVATSCNPSLNSLSCYDMSFLKLHKLFNLFCWKILHM